MPSSRQIVLCRYRYDPLDRIAATAPLSTTAFQRFYCKSRLATEIQGQVTHSIFQHDDQLLAQQQSGGNTVETTLLATDQQRSVLHAFNASPPQPIAYSPYGHRPADSGLLSLLGFNGERRDPVTGYYLLGNGYRAFNPVLMRFNSPDSHSPFDDGGLNAYAYCLGDPVNWEDGTGRIPVPILKQYLVAAAFKSVKKTISRIPRRMTNRHISSSAEVIALSGSTNANTANVASTARTEALQTIGKREFQEVFKRLEATRPVEKQLKRLGKLRPFQPNKDAIAVTREYRMYRKSGLPFSRTGVPQKGALFKSVDPSGKTYLRDDAYSASLNYFHHQAETSTGIFKLRMQENAGQTIINRAADLRMRP